jgi:alkane 1-monooxygenase
MNTMASPSTPPLPAVPYRDRKRHLWLLSVAVPAAVGAGPALWLWTGEAWTLWLPVFFSYVIVPLLDMLLGVDRSNPPEAAVPQLDADRYYRRITYLLVPVLWVAFVFCVWFVASHDLPWHGVLACLLIGGAVGGFAINLGHELGHKGTPLERWLAKIVLAPSGYGHFHVEHNRGHHRDVATPADPASSRMGENIYRFTAREIPGAARRAWVLEATRLRGAGLPVWSLHNQILQPALITVALWGALVAWLGWTVLPFVLLMAFWSWFQLSSANYVEHYGLLRGLDANGRYEPCQPHHSWNSNHVFSNWALFHLQRHSDHHAHPLRRYQSLRHFERLPQLPNGYFGMFLVAYLPPLWFRLMDGRLLQVVGRDPARINFAPGARARLMKKHGLAG